MENTEQKQNNHPGIPRVLLLEPRDDLYSSELSFVDNVKDLAAGRFEIEPNTWTDALMKSYTPLYRAVLMDCGRIGDYEFDVIRKLKGELGVPMILHSTEDRQPVIKEARDEGVAEFCRKPFGAVKLVEILVQYLE